MRTAVDQEVVARRGTGHVVTSVGQRCRRDRSAGLWRREPGASPSIHKASSGPSPIRSSGRSTSEDAAARLARDRRDRVQNRQQRPSIVVADVRDAAVVVREQPRCEGQACHGVCEHRRRFEVAGLSRGDQRERVEIEGVAVIVRGPLAVAAVGRDLTPDLLAEDGPADRGATPACGELGQRSSDHIERQRLAEQMCVGTEIVGKVVLDVRELAIEPEEQVDEPWRSTARGGRLPNRGASTKR